MTNEEELYELEEEIALISANLKKLYAKTNQSVSFGDQTYTLVNAMDLEAARSKKRARVRELERLKSGKKARPSHKVHFPSC